MSLDKHRKKIDEIDEKIIRLLNERTEHALSIGEKKKKGGKEIYSPSREFEIYKKIEAENKGPLPSSALKLIYREIMSASLSLEKDLSIAYLGPEASFTHLAALSKFGSSVDYSPYTTITDVFQAVEKKQVDYGVVPIENSTEGAVNHTLDMFVDSENKICSEIHFDISHNLMSNSKRTDVKKIYSHAQAIGQCRHWIEVNMPNAKLIETSSTTDAAKKASKEKGSAAIASSLAATLYNLKILAESIEDSAQNKTRFLIISKTYPPKTGSDKTSLVVSIKDKVGALYDILSPIQKNKINMTKIESRPSKKKAWDYFFYIDLEGHVDNANIKKTITEMEKNVKYLKVLGSYPVYKEKK